ncbi:hypothetical protein [Actinobaculum sp. 352]|nr:hypothetical protein [Actinobaculum sp. 352]
MFTARGGYFALGAWLLATESVLTNGIRVAGRLSEAQTLVTLRSRKSEA